MTKRLLAMVEEHEFSYTARVERTDGEGIASENHSVKGPLDGLLVAERVAVAHGFGIRWHGLVGHGFELPQKEGAPTS